jgi:hypothetical protein
VRRAADLLPNAVVEVLDPNLSDAARNICEINARWCGKHIAQLKSLRKNLFVINRLRICVISHMG